MSSLRFHLQELDALGEDDLAVHTLSGHITDLTVGSIKLVQALNRSARTVADPVVLEITECNGDGFLLLPAEKFNPLTIHWR